MINGAGYPALTEDSREVGIDFPRRERDESYAASQY
jgi:hypothetical protein